MKKIIFILLGITFLSTCLNAQFDNNFHFGDSIKMAESIQDSKAKTDLYIKIGSNYVYYKGDSSLYYLNIAKDIAQKNNLYDRLIYADFYISNVYKGVLGNYPLGIFYAFEMLKDYDLVKEHNSKIENISFNNVASAYFTIADAYSYLGNKEKTKEYINKFFSTIRLDTLNTTLQGNYISNTSKIFFQIRELDSAYKYIQQGIAINNTFSPKWSFPFMMMGDVLLAKKEYQKAIYNYKAAIPLAIPWKFYKDVFQCNYGIAFAYFNLNKIDSAIYYATEVQKMSKTITFTEGSLKNSLLLYSLYKIKNNKDSALKYIEMAEDLRNNIFNNIKANDAQNMAINEEVKQRELREQKAKQQKILIITGICAILLAIGIYLNGKRKQRERLRQIEEERKNSELRAARDLQQSMLPKENPKRSDLDIATFIRSSTEVGGDYYDFFPQADGSIFSVCGDATGHGVTSGMMVSVAKAGLNGISPVKPNKILQRLNGVVKRIDLGTLRMSLNIAEITQDEVYLSSAAMPPIYLYKASTKSIEEFMNNGLPLGGLRDEEFVLEARNFESGDVLVQLSDGLPEAPNSKGEMYDYDRLRNLILASVHLSSKEIIDVLMKSVDEWMEGKHNPDDITLVVTKKK